MGVVAGKAHDANVYSSGSQPNRVYRLFLEHMGEPLTPRMIEEATGTTAPATLVSTVRRQLSDRYRMRRTTIRNDRSRKADGKAMGAWVLERVDVQTHEPISSEGQGRLSLI